MTPELQIAVSFGLVFFIAGIWFLAVVVSRIAAVLEQIRDILLEINRQQIVNAYQAYKQRIPSGGRSPRVPD